MIKYLIGENSRAQKTTAAMILPYGVADHRYSWSFGYVILEMWREELRRLATRG
jgi:hypothetical protein